MCLSPTAECYGVFAQYRFRCVLGELGRFREGTGFREPVPGTGSGNQFWESVLGDRFSGSGEAVLGTGSGLRWVPTGLAAPRNQVLDAKVPGSGCVPEVSKVSVLDRFRRLGSVPEVWTERVRGTSSGNPRY